MPEAADDTTSVIFTADVVAAGAAAAAADAPLPGAGGESGPVDEDAAKPTGSPRVGRARRSGLLPARLKAKRPDEDVLPIGEPLAAEPPGASVADVPGAGRRKTGLAGLAAADRAADQEHGQEVAAAVSVDDTSAAVEPRSRRRFRGASRQSDQPLRSSANYTPEATGV